MRRNCETTVMFTFGIDFISSPLAYLDPTNCNLTHMLVQLFKDALNEYAYAAELAGLKWELVNTKYGLIVSYITYFLAWKLKLLLSVRNCRIQQQTTCPTTKNYG